MSDSSALPKSCPKCGAELPSEATEGLCPRCLMAEAMQPTGPKTPAGPWQPPSAEELQKLLPQYEITMLLGRGGMGAVYKGTQISLDRPVAIKILSNDLETADASFAERFKNEARAMAKLSHPGIVAVHDFGETPDHLLYIVMEFIEGTDVSRMIAKQKRLHTEHAMAITAHVCDALAYAHERGIIHRDIKPANIMVGYDGVVKVADFGLAKMSNKAGESLGLTQSGMAMGTLHYMAPEALMLGAGVDHRADIYAVGVMLYQMLTGKVPHGMFELPSLQVSGLDPRYDGIIAKAMREDRDIRYQRASEMRFDLDHILTQPVVKVESDATQAPAALPTEARPQRTAGQPYRPPQPQVIVRAQKSNSARLWVALIAACGVAAWLFFKGGDDLQTQTAASASPTGTAPAVVANTPSPASLTGDPATATKDKPFVNSLGMKFVPIAGTKVLMCIHETRKQDYAAYALENPGVNVAWRNQTLDGAKVITTDDHPVSGVTWKDAKAFCAWLGNKDKLTYRLPTDREWSFAVGIAEMEDAGKTPYELRDGINNVWPWGTTFPPKQPLDNLSDETRRVVTGVPHGITGYTDGFPYTSPVMSFPPNSNGLYDMGGNVGEWTEDLFRGDQPQWHSIRGGTFLYTSANWSLSGHRTHRDSENARLIDFGFRCVINLASSPASVATVSATTVSPAPAKTAIVGATQAPLMTTAKLAELAAQETGPLALPVGPTTWTDTKGRSITATFKAIASGNVLLEIAGKVTPVAMNTLSVGSQKLARDYQEQAKPTVPASASSTFAFAEKPTSLFDGKSLDGWRIVGSPSAFIVEDGAIKATGVAGNLFYVGQGAPPPALLDFDLSLKVKTGPLANSGIFFHCATLSSGYQFAPQAQIANENKDSTKTGSLREVANVATMHAHDGVWFDYRIVIQGREARLYIDGQEVNRWTQPADWQPTGGRTNFRLGSGTFGLESSSGEAWFKDIQLKILTPSSSAATSRAPPTSTITAATKDKPFTNTLGMPFVPVPGTKTLFCIHETRKKDYRVFALERSDLDITWQNQVWRGHPVGPSDDHPVTGVSWDDAKAFCAWLSTKAGNTYRLPTDREWSAAVGIADREPEGKTPFELRDGVPDVWSWGSVFPPKTPMENLADLTLHDAVKDASYLPGYTDGFVTTAPVMSFPPNSLGIHDLGGNVTEWVEDLFAEPGRAPTDRTLRMGSFILASSHWSLASHRTGREPRATHLPELGFRVVLELPAP
ncbi:MAG: SUMF1/EgtB/PvdO family nonheme iron enzyme [Prosthecobacter sp.]|uniref:SUMF1/EgtB/PvdO family nonheme iron enzyme n=1 Tax=Prosthecobacter sp. TaxID=1965333 RepID=UPI0039003AFB